MPGVVRLGDKCTGHNGYPSRPNDEASTKVFVNNRGVHRLGDHWPQHCNNNCHQGFASSSSGSVFADGIGVCRIGDSVNCGSSMMEGSSDVFAGD